MKDNDTNSNSKSESAERRLRVLIVEDEPGMVDFIQLGLGYEGFETFSAPDGRKGLELALGGKPDLIILDLMLPFMDGIELCRQLRQVSSVPVIMLTARDEVDDRVRGLEAGADDYLTKPFSFKELVARIRAVLRRQQASAPAQPGQVLSVADLRLDELSREVRRGDRLIELSLREYELLELFMQHPNQVLKRQIILDRVWGYDFVGDTNIIEVYVRYLRNKLGEPDLIQTVRGVGYAMRSQPSATKEG